MRIRTLLLLSCLLALAAVAAVAAVAVDAGSASAAELCLEKAGSGALCRELLNWERRSYQRKRVKHERHDNVHGMRRRITSMKRAGQCRNQSRRSRWYADVSIRGGAK
jgi:hypothetical protein